MVARSRFLFDRDRSLTLHPAGRTAGDVWHWLFRTPHHRILGGLGKLVTSLPPERIAYQPIPDLAKVRIAEIVDQVTPRVGDLADSGDESDDAADFQPVLIYRPAADQERADDL